MPALPAVPSVVRVAFIGTNGATTDVMWRRYYQYSGTAPTDTQLATFASSVAAGWASHMAALHSGEYVLTNVKCEDLTSATSAVGEWTGTNAGSRSGTPLPGGAAALLSHIIARRYRGGHPRTYLPAGVGPDVDAPGLWQSAFTAAVSSGFAALAGSIASAVWSGGTIAGDVNVSYYEGFTPFKYPSGRYRNIPNLRTTPLIDAITSFVVNAAIASQRRRNVIV